MPDLTAEGSHALDDIARRYGVGRDAARDLLAAVAYGGGTMAQFSHPELGGMGQWSAGGMIMVGDMFNHGLKQRVDGLCKALADLLRAPGMVVLRSADQGHPGSGQWWPAELGAPSTSGAQNDMKYAYFPDRRRLAVLQGGALRVYDTGDHQIGGVSQQQGGGQSLVFTSQYGSVSLADLARGQADQPIPPPMPAADATDPVARIEQLAQLHQRGILSDQEFVSKKAELLSRI